MVAAPPKRVVAARPKKMVAALPKKAAVALPKRTVAAPRVVAVRLKRAVVAHPKKVVVAETLADPACLVPCSHATPATQAARLRVATVLPRRTAPRAIAAAAAKKVEKAAVKVKAAAVGPQLPQQLAALLRFRRHRSLTPRPHCERAVQFSESLIFARRTESKAENSLENGLRFGVRPFSRS